MAVEYQGTIRLLSVDALVVVEAIHKVVGAYMFPSNRVLMTCLIATTVGCAIEQKTERVFDVRDYCWTAEHFAKVDFERAAFVQFVNDDMVIYRLTESEMLYCAYPVNNDFYKEQARRRGVPFTEYQSVIP